MSSILDQIGQHLTPDRIATLSQSIGATPEQTQQAISAALPTILGAISRNASTPEGEQSLHQSLTQDHDGSALNHLDELVRGDLQIPTPAATSRSLSGGEILDHVLGNRKDRVQAGVGSASGLSSGQVIKLMMTLAPIVMAAIGRHRKQEDLSPGGVGSLVRDDQKKVEKQSSATGSMVSRMLDQDGDGDFDMMDVIKFGMSRLFGHH